MIFSCVKINQSSKTKHPSDSLPTTDTDESHTCLLVWFRCHARYGSVQCLRPTSRIRECWTLPSLYIQRMVELEWIIKENKLDMRA